MTRLNLLPPEYRVDIETSKKNAALYQNLIKVIAGLVLAGAFMGVIGYIVWNNQSVAQASRDDAYDQVSAFTAVQNTARDLNSRLSLIQKLRDDRIDWAKVFSEITKSTPANVRLTDIDFTNASTDRIAFSGFALSNTDVGSFRELLSNSTLFKFVDIESVTAGNDPSNSSRSGVNFVLSMTMDMTEAKK
jgi:Tfp pilus assembly protein PilN